MLLMTRRRRRSRKAVRPRTISNRCVVYHPSTCRCMTGPCGRFPPRLPTAYPRPVAQADWSTDALDAAGWEGLLARADDVFGRALTRRPHDVVAAAADANRMIDDLMEVTGEFHADARSLLARIMHRYGSVLRGAACAGSEPCAAAAAAVSEDSESDTEDEQRAPLKIERVPCGQEGLLSIMTLRLAPASGKGVARSSKYGTHPPRPRFSEFHVTASATADIGRPPPPPPRIRFPQCS